jgi:hypothetical protein
LVSAANELEYAPESRTPCAVNQENSIASCDPQKGGAFSYGKAPPFCILSRKIVMADDAHVVSFLPVHR